MAVLTSFAKWRKEHNLDGSWGLAWFLANEICDRFYASHGLDPRVIAHDGLGYYGIELDTVACRVCPNESKPLGRITAGGDIENWQSGSTGDHRLNSIDMCERGASEEELVRGAIRHLDLRPIPHKSHVQCRHKRWGDSYKLCFEIATLIALTHDADEIRIWNHPYHVDEKIRALDSQCAMKEHPGAFSIQGGGGEFLLIGDGRVLGTKEENIWESFMLGEPSASIATRLSERLT